MRCAGPALPSNNNPVWRLAGGGWCSAKTVTKDGRGEAPSRSSHARARPNEGDRVDEGAAAACSVGIRIRETGDGMRERRLGRGEIVCAARAAANEMGRQRLRRPAPSFPKQIARDQPANHGLWARRFSI